MVKFVILLFATALAACAADDERTWTDRAGRTFTGRIVACDALRATIDVAGRGKIVAPLAALSPPDADFAQRWRRETPRAPLIDPARLPAWPAQAVAENLVVRAVEDDPATHRFAWESAHFQLAGDLKLPPGIVRDLAAVFEATREVLLTAPLGLIADDERERYRVRLFSDAAGYHAAGGAAGTGGFFDGREMLILLPNLGIKPGANGLTAEHTRNLFVLKHEVTHQLLRPWSGSLPVWLQEGFAECVASWPSTQGRYSLQNLDAAMHDYLLKWRRRPDERTLRLVAPAVLMDLSSRDWSAQITAQSAYDHYNSAALLTHYFLRHDGRGDSAGLVAYFDAIRRGDRPADAESQFLLRGRSRADLAAELQKLARRLAIGITFAP